MKKVILFTSLIAITLLAQAQTWYGNNPTFNDGFVGDVNYTGTATINGHVTFSSGSVGTLTGLHLTSGAVLTLTTSEILLGSTVEAGATIAAQDHLVFDNTNTIAGTITVVNTMEVDNTGLVLSGCAFIKCGNLIAKNSNIFSGSGLIYVTGVYSYQGSNDGPTQSSGILFNITTYESTNIGKGTKSTKTTSPCLLSTPVTFVDAPHVIAVYPNYVTVQFAVANQSEMKQYNIQLSNDQGKTWYTAEIVIPDNTVVGATYTVNVNLKK